jgi:uncharacterized membrane protein YdfJ with MMPL/SSD domain
LALGAIGSFAVRFRWLVLLAWVVGGAGRLGLALGVLMDTFLVRTLLIPSTVVLLGRWNWWSSRMSKISPDQPAGQAPDRAGGDQNLPLATQQTR